LLDAAEKNPMRILAEQIDIAKGNIIKLGEKIKKAENLGPWAVNSAKRIAQLNEQLVSAKENLKRLQAISAQQKTSEVVPAVGVSDAAERVLASLRFEQEQLGRTAVQQRISNELRKAGADITNEEAAAITALVVQVEKKIEAKKNDTKADEERARLSADFIALTLELANEETKLAAAAKARQAMVNNALSMEVISKQEAADLKVQIEADYQLQLAALRNDAAEIQVAGEIATAERIAAVWIAKAETYIGLAQQMATMGAQYALADEEQQKNTGKRMLATAIRYLTQKLAFELMEKAREKVFTASAAAAQITAATSVATADMAIGAARAAAWAVYYKAHAANPIGAAFFGASAKLMPKAVVALGAAGVTSAFIGAAGVSANLTAAAGYAAASIGVAALGEALASRVEGSLSGSGDVPGEGTTTLPVITESAEEATVVTTQSPTININIYGNVVDHDQFARDIIPSLQKAVNDGMSL